MNAMRSHPRRFRLLLLAGLLLRLATLTLPGTEDVQVWKTWSFGATTDLTAMYGVGGSPPERGVVRWGSRVTTVDYPPGTLYGLGVIGAAYRWIDPPFEDTTRLTAVIKLSILAMDALTGLLIFRIARSGSDDSTARLAALFYWLNPAAILDGAVLGYLDPWLAALVLGAVAAASANWWIAAGALVAAALLVKLQAIFIVPVLALMALAPPGAYSRVVRAAAGVAITGVIGLAPYAWRGALPNVMQGVGSLLRHDMLSGTAANLWWIVTWLLRASYAVTDLGAWGAWTMTVRILGISRVVALGYPNPRPIGTLMVIAAAGWAMWRTYRAREQHPARLLAIAAGAFVVHAYFVLALQVHENHLYLAIPLLAIVAAQESRYRRVLVFVSVIFAGNLFLFYGIGRGFPLPPRHFTVIDATVVLSIVNVVAVGWHGRRLAKLTAGAPI